MGGALCYGKEESQQAQWATIELALWLGEIMGLKEEEGGRRR